MPDFTIVTPSFNSLQYLPRACASVADQAGVTAEHIVLDGGSADGTADWLRRQSKLRVHIGPDAGMYDAINHGFQLSRGSIVGHLNCDEQYLPGTLAAVADYFATHPHVSIVCGSILAVDPRGDILAFRKIYPLRWRYVMGSHLYASTCALFYRRDVINAGYRFDTQYRVIGDIDFVIRVLRAGYRVGLLKQYVSTFAITGENLSLRAQQELQAYKAALPRWIKWGRYPLNMARLIEKTLSGAYTQAFPFEYAIYDDSLVQRRVYTVRAASARWRAGWTDWETAQLQSCNSPDEG